MFLESATEGLSKFSISEETSTFGCARWLINVEIYRFPVVKEIIASVDRQS